MNSARVLFSKTVASGNDDDLVADPTGDVPNTAIVVNAARVPGNGRLAFEFWYEWLNVSGAPVYDSSKQCTLRPILAVTVPDIGVRYLDAGDAQTVSARNPIHTDDVLNKDTLYILVTFGTPPTDGTQIRVEGRELEL